MRAPGGRSSRAQRHPDVGARGDAAEQAFLPRQAPRRGEGVLVGHRHDGIHEVAPVNARDESGAGALDAMAAGSARGPRARGRRPARPPRSERPVPWP